jgi:hypothetical protein
MYRLLASGTPGGDPLDGSASASGTSGDPVEDGSADEQVQEPDPEAIEAELERLRHQNRQLLSEKSSAEESRREARELRQIVLDMNRRLSREEGESPADQERVEELRRTVGELQASDDPRDKFVLEMARELQRTKKQLDEVSSNPEGVKIPEEDISDVNRLLRTGDYKTSKAAYKALLGERYQKMQSGDGKPKPAVTSGRSDRVDTPSRPMSTVSRPVPREKAKERKVVKASEYRQLLRGDDAKDWRQKRVSGDITVVPG